MFGFMIIWCSCLRGLRAKGDVFGWGCYVMCAGLWVIIYYYILSVYVVA